MGKRIIIFLLHLVDQLWYARISIIYVYNGTNVLFIIEKKGIVRFFPAYY